MAANTEDLSDSTVSGFHTIDTRRFEGFTPQNLDEFNRILLSIKKNDKFNFLESFRQQIESHIANPAGHRLAFNLLEDEIVEQLYTLYTNSGYTGTKLDMLQSVYKNITVGDSDDVKAGIAFDKAMHVVFWKQWFDKHNDGLDSHMTIRKAFYPVNTVNKVAAVNINDYNPTKEVTFDKNWNSSEMTINFTYDFSTKVNGELFMIIFDNDTSMEITGSDTGVTVTYEDYSATIDFPENLTIDKYLIYFDNEKLVFRDALTRKIISSSDSTDSSDAVRIIDGTATSITFASTAGDFGSSIPWFSAFAGSIRESEELFYVN
jgi:hypothetical protein